MGAGSKRMGTAESKDNFLSFISPTGFLQRGVKWARVMQKLGLRGEEGVQGAILLTRLSKEGAMGVRIGLHGEGGETPIYASEISSHKKREDMRGGECPETFRNERDKATRIPAHHILNFPKKAWKRGQTPQQGLHTPQKSGYKVTTERGEGFEKRRLNEKGRDVVAITSENPGPRTARQKMSQNKAGLRST